MDIRPLTPDDLRAVIEMEKMSQLRPWSESSFRGELRNPFSRLNVLRQGDEVAGYICYHILFEELFILNLVTAPCFRRQGVARRLLDAAISEARGDGVKKAFLEVRVSNLAATSLYASFGFQKSARRKKYYSDGEDGLVMERSLSD
jgi:ribosomal-protein-alanine N-acetyltransferase